MMQGKRVLITGANSGIGKEAAVALAAQGAQIVMLCRSRQRAEAALAEIIQRSGNDQIEIVLADFASLASVAQAAETINQRYQRIDVLLNNAGAYFSTRETSQDGYEMTFAVNHLAPFLLTKLLLPTLEASTPARIINVSSDAHRFTGMNFKQLHNPSRYQGLIVYSRSKLANVLFTYALAEQLKDRNITVNALHPGVIASNFAAGGSDVFAFIIESVRRFMITPEQGAQTSIYLASSPEVAQTTGKYFEKSKERRSSAASYDRASQQQLWQLSEELIAAKLPYVTV
jgi:NAD(P)-dependent dehydrogenase (short-subunit alcohol dehydrogenase family)